MLLLTSEYALRVMVFLARRPLGIPVLGSVLAKELSIPAQYLSKVLSALARAGLLQSSRGHGGGYRLELDPRRIRLLDVVAIFEGDRLKSFCLLGAGLCNKKTPCVAHARWKRIQDARQSFLSETTIGDLSIQRARRKGAGVG